MAEDAEEALLSQLLLSILFQQQENSLHTVLLYNKIFNGCKPKPAESFF